ncbi:glycosyltransferase family 4 protein [Nocardiopsis composta]|uniref:Glycosyltransferase involved in cell wall biosynthesis n=1 Tax=Nocardiopsis composta TaxID=157465 RepID=A0A7W8VH55_9ACTN|nr:glycosyltransferase family 4 protein [Nocardiopsis composta]MBB5435835.1 glycosyltransferase involved in cell wall biosynthesis [Nocardiopsis composta]
MPDRRSPTQPGSSDAQQRPEPEEAASAQAAAAPSLTDRLRDGAARTGLRTARRLSPGLAERVRRLADPAGGPDAPADLAPRLPALTLLLLAAGEEVDEARRRMPGLTRGAGEPTRRGLRSARRIAAVLAAAERPRMTESALRALPPLPPPYASSLGGAVAVRRARILFEQGRMAEAEAEVRPFTAGHGVAALMYERLRGERRALGPLPALPGREDPPLDPVPGRVLHLVSNALPKTSAGYTVRTHRIVTAQRDAGLDPSVAAFPGWPLDAPPGTAGRYELDGIGYHRVHPGRELPGGLAGQIDAGVEAVCALARELRPGVLHAATDHRNGSIAVAAGARLGLPVVYEVRGFLEETWLSAAGEAARGGERHRLIVERESALVRTADAVVTLSETMRAELVARGAEEDRIVLAPNAVDPALLDARPDGDAFRCAHGLEPGDFVVGSVSSIVGYEGFTTLVRAVGLLRDRGVPAHLLLVGDGKARPEVEAAVRDLGLSELCVLPGRVDRDEALRAQAALDVLVVPRADERVCRLVTPLKPVEAMALGTPVVASDLPALRELLCGGEAGLMVPPGEPGPLADALQRLREDGELRAGLAAAGRTEVAEHRTWPRVAAVYRDLYTRLAP